MHDTTASAQKVYSGFLAYWRRPYCLL